VIHRILIILCFSFLLVLSYMFQDMPHGDNFALDCDLCHATDTWQVLTDSVKFRHSETGFALIGAHKNTQCRSCHEKLEFNYIGTACIDCHPDIHKSELGFRCENCHTPLSWENRREVFEQHIQTNFPLIGVHALLDCQSCHIDEQNREFVNLPVECQGCHLEDFNQTVNPDHKKASFDQECQSCHPANSVIWNQSIYHHTDLFPLAGGHSSSECRDCHSDIYFGLSADCYSCHQTDYENANDPNHLTFGFPEDCRACHNIYNW
jgi:hypothetical protein